MRNEGGGFAAILRLRSQLFWHSLSHIRRFSPLRMTKQGDARRWHASHQSRVTRGYSSLLSNFKLHGSGVVCSIPTLKRKSISMKKTLLKESFLLLVIGCSGGSLSVLWETSNLRGASDFYAPHHHFSFLIQEKLSSPIKGRVAPRG